MADLETGLNIPVSAYADKNSAEKATNDLIKGVLNSLKNGYIEVPAEIKASFNRGSKELDKAQKDVINQWEKMSKEGFSSSEEYLDDLISKYKKFKSLAGKEGKGNSKQTKWLTKTIGETIQPYLSQKRELEKIIAGFESNTKKPRNFGKHTKEEIDANIKQHRNRQYKGIEKVVPKGLKTDSGIDPGRTTEYAIKQSEISSYASNFARQMSRSAKEAKIWENSTFSRDKYDTADALNAEVERRHKTDTLKSGNKKRLTPMEKAKGLSDDLLPLLSDLINKIQNSESDNEIQALSEQFFDTSKAIFTYSEEAGTKIYSTAKKELGEALKQFYTVSGNIGTTDGTDKAEGTRNEHIENLLKGLLDQIGQKEEEIKQELIKLEQLETKSTTNKVKTKSQTKEINSIANKMIGQVINESKQQSQKSNEIVDAIESTQKITDKQVQLDMIEHSAERVADASLEKINTANANDGFNSEQNATTLINEVKNLNKNNNQAIPENVKEIFKAVSTKMDMDNCPCQTILEAIANNVQLIANSLNIGVEKNISGPPAIIPPDTVKTITTTIEKSGLPDLYRYFKDGKWLTAGVIDHDKRPTALHDVTDWDRVRRKRLESDVEKERENAIQQNIEKVQKEIIPKSNMVQLSKDLSSSIRRAFGIKDLGPNASAIMGMSQAEQEKLRAQRISTFGLADINRNATATGARSNIFYRKSIYRGEQNTKNPFEGLQLTPGMGIDTKSITDALQTTIQKNMFNAQTGGTLRNLLGSMTLYAGMPSLEKTRAEADGLNQIMANIRQVVLELLQAIQGKETDLRGLEKSGQVAFNDQGELVSDLTKNKEGTKLFADMEEQKQALRGVLAELNMVDQLVDSTGGNIAKILQQLGFVAPELRKNNAIIQNLNAGLDKNGKALKFQTRTAEVLNYSFRLMARHVGQMVKRWMLQLNPITQIKKAFQDFASYDVKWQRTMNVIKYNIRRIIRPFMEWLAQQFVNLIGLANALIKGIGRAFNKDWDLFDQSAASAEQMREELEAAANVSAGFDELHDIGGESSSNPAMDLMGDIYTPQWDGLNDLLERIGETIGKIIDAVSHFTFWDWLKLAGAALVGFLALKTLINWFTGRNPLQSVAKGFSFLEKAVGWAALITSFALFTKALTDFVETMKSASWGDIAKSLVTLAGAFTILVGAMMILGRTVTTDWKSLLGMAALVGVFDLLVGALIPFIKTLKEVTAEELMTGLIFLAGALVSVAVAVGILGAIFTAIATTGIGLAALGILAGILLIVPLVINALANLVRAFGEAGPGIKQIMEGIATVITAVGEQVTNVFTVIGNTIVRIVEAIAEGITNTLQPMLEFINNITDTIVRFAETIAHEIGETIRTVIETVGNVIIGIIDSLLGAIPKLLNAILKFIGGVGPAIERSADAIMRTITKLINFTISGIEYLVNTLLIDSINAAISAVTFGAFSHVFDRIEIQRFVPQYEQGTNYVPNDGLAYLHQGEAVVPKKYNQPYQQGLSAEEKAYMYQMMTTMRSLDSTMKQGITVNGQFTQRGSDLVAVVNKTKSQTGSDLLSNVAYAR